MVVPPRLHQGRGSDQHWLPLEEVVRLCCHLEKPSRYVTAWRAGKPRDEVPGGQESRFPASASYGGIKLVLAWYL